ncbi:nucleoside triphosphate pyrophosphatase [Ammoniphilus sp. 3BR4]|uniref:Maf family protein n=1 Tax=Ammoniphilus sp. 3BR4 TaxID=3158265 RepID=UPI003465CDF8
MGQTNEREIILASSSPRRQEMLRNLGLKFIIHPSGADESVDDGLKPDAIVEMLAERKAADVASQYSEGVVIGSDTIVVLEGKVLGKPNNEKDAFSMLSSLQGTTHSVFSGLAIIDAGADKKKIGHVETKVTMRPISSDEILRYIATKEPMDKAGSYAIQGLGSIFIEGIVGDYFSVVGLPVRLMAEYLEDFGISILAP